MGLKVFVVLAVVGASVLPAECALGAPVPDTGQTKCYDDTKEVACPEPGEDYYGQDAQYLINPISYTKLDADGNDLPDSAASWAMVRDNITELVWEVKHNKDGVQDYSDPHDSDNSYTWYDSSYLPDDLLAGAYNGGKNTEDFIKALNNAKFGGKEDWRLPIVEELVGLVDFSLPPIGAAFNDDFFPAQQMTYYLTSMTYPRLPGNAWNVYCGWGIAGYGSKSSAWWAMAVRGSAGAKRFVDNGDMTVTDIFTGLMWQQSSGSGNWKEALKYCEDSNLAGYTDWRLPTIKELHSLLDGSRFNPAINDDYFQQVSTSFWSSTTVSKSGGDHDTAWAVSGYDATNGSYFKTGYNSVRAVRGGQKKVTGNIFITSPSQGSFWCGGAAIPIRWDTAGLGGDVRISISAQGGKAGTFSTIAGNTPNDGAYDWPATGNGSYNCVLKIEPLGDGSKGTEQGLFTIILPAARILNGPAECYATIQEAYDAAMNSDVIQAQGGFFSESLFLDRNITVYLEGGYNAAYSSSSMGSGVITITITKGTAILKDFFAGGVGGY